MRLHSPTFERALRAGIRRAIRSSPALKREYRAAAKYRRQYSAMVLVRPFMSVVLVAMVGQVVTVTGQADAALAVATLWSFLAVLIHAQGLLTRLYRSPDLGAVLLLPLSEDKMFRWQLQKFWRGTLWLLLDLAGSCAIIAWNRQAGLGAWLAVLPVAAAAWAQVLCLSALCVAYLPRLPYGLASSTLLFAVFVLAGARKLLAPLVLSCLVTCGPTLNLLLPTGWPATLFRVFLPGGHWLFLVLVIPIGAVVWSLRNTLARLRATYRFYEPIRPESPDLIPGEAPEPQPAADEDASPAHLGLTAIEEIVQSRQFLQAPAWPQRGWLESLLWRWLTTRERVLSELVFPAGVEFSRPWRRVFRNLAVILAATLVVGWISTGISYWVVGVGLFVTLCQVVGRVIGNGRAFQPVPCSGVNIPVYTVYAVGYRELGRLLLKYSTVQAPAVLAIGLVAGLVVGHLAGVSPVPGVVFGLKAGGLLLASRLVFIALAFSAGTNDTTGIRLRNVVLLGFVAVGCLTFAGLAGASLLVPFQPLAWLLWTLAWVVAWLFFRAYGWFYNAFRFDLMSQPR